MNYLRQRFRLFYKILLSLFSIWLYTIKCQKTQGTHRIISLTFQYFAAVKNEKQNDQAAFMV